MRKGKAKPGGTPTLRTIPLAKSVLGVVALGACLGVGLAWLQRQASQGKLEAAWQVPQTLSPLLFPQASSPASSEALPPLGLPVAMEGLPLYPGSMPYSLEAHVLADGKPLEMARFSTEDSVEQLRAFYEKALRLRGLHLVSHAFSPQAGYIGYMDWLNEELHLVSYIRQGSQTLVFPSRSRPAERFTGELPQGLPAHPRASRVKTVAFLEPEGSRRLSYSASIAAERLEAVQHFYREALLAGGWRGLEEREEGVRSTLEAAQEGRAINVSFEQKPGEVQVYILWMAQGP